MIQIFIDKLPSEKKTFSNLHFLIWNHKNSNNQFQWFLNFAANYLFFPSSSCNYHFGKKGKIQQARSHNFSGNFCPSDLWFQKLPLSSSRNSKIILIIVQNYFHFLWKICRKDFQFGPNFDISHSWYQNVWWLLDYEKNCFCGSTNLIDFVNLVYSFIYVSLGPI